MQPGKLDVVTGYFSMRGLNLFNENFNSKIEEFRLLIGELVKADSNKDRVINWLNDTMTVSKGIRNNELAAQQLVNFLLQEKVRLKTVKPNFCHAKSYIFHDGDSDAQKNFYVTGSSNLTEAGLGCHNSPNIELNVADFGAKSEYDDVRKWFDELWKNEAKEFIVVEGKKRDYKGYLIELIQESFRKYTPHEIYFKILFELFASELLSIELDPDFAKRIGHLQGTKIYNALYDFQRGGVHSLIRMLQQYGGAILADAVGLGKTLEALAVMKFFELEGHEVILLCPKKLFLNWDRYLYRKGSRFNDDRFDYVIRYHTDLQEDRIDKDGITLENHFRNDKPKLIVIDESHNLRNDKSQRYKFLVEEILKANKQVKVLMLSATPINTKLIDVRNQFKLIVQGRDEGFTESFEIQSLQRLFAIAQKRLDEWQANPAISHSIQYFIKSLSEDFLNLSDKLIVARTRKLIEKHNTKFKFPHKEKPENIFISPDNIGNLKTFDDIFRACVLNLTGYRPSEYTSPKEVTSAIEDERQRDRFLVKMMYILMMKRLESSWHSFGVTISRIYAHHLNALEKVEGFIKSKNESTLIDETDQFESEVEETEEDDSELQQAEYTLGKRRPVHLKEIVNIKRFKNHLEQDILKLKKLSENVALFAKGIEAEKGDQSEDKKLQKLIDIIKAKQQQYNKKIVIFSVFTDTVGYLYTELQKRGFKRIAMVFGGGGKTDSGYSSSKFEPILERFAPFTKLYMEKEWQDFFPDPTKSDTQNFLEWKKYIADGHPQIQELLENPIDILIATDCLSEGQNLQDADTVVNYDIHWNPVRIIQRMGRIDRLSSPNETIKGYNFWCADSYEDLLNLKNRVEKRMALLSLVGAELDQDLTPELQQLIKDNPLLERQAERMIEQMQTTWDDIAPEQKAFGLDDLSMELFRQELHDEIMKERHKYENMPPGVFSGFRTRNDLFVSDLPQGMIALLGSPPKQLGDHDHQYYKNHLHLLYTTPEGDSKFINLKEILAILSAHKHESRFVFDGIDQGIEDVLKPYTEMLLKWLKNKAGDSENNVAGDAALNALLQLAAGKGEVKQTERAEKFYVPDNFDIIAWFAVSK